MSNVLKSVIILGVLLIAASSTLYVVSETERGVKLRFGRLVEADIQPGLHIKIPLADDVRLFDARILTVDAQPASFFTVEKKRLIVDSYAKWRIANVETTTKRLVELKQWRITVWLIVSTTACAISLVLARCMKWSLVNATH